MNKIALLLIIVSFSAFGKASKRYEPVATPTPTPEVVQPTDSGTENITFTCANCTKQEAANIQIVQHALPAIINSKCFLEHYTLDKYRTQLVQTNGLSRAEVVEKIRTTKVKNIPIFFYYPTWRQSKSVVGYTSPDTPTIYLNRLFRNGYDWGACAEISNALHEVTHKMGFDHDYKATARRPYSVPYTANFAVAACCNDSDYKNYKND